MADETASFRDWLIDQKDRRDSVGRLGSHFAEDEEAANLVSVDEVRDYIQAEPDYQPVHEPLDRAIAEYRLLSD